MGWRVALVDSCGIWPGALDSAAFALDGETFKAGASADATGHGSRIARLLTSQDAPIDLLLAQVFQQAGATSAAAVAAGVDWAVARGANLIHMSLGLDADRALLAVAVERAVASGCLLIASTPARGATVYPAAYPNVIRATGDARCAPGEISRLAPWVFGGCPRVDGAEGLRAAAGAGERESIGGAATEHAIVGVASSERAIGGAAAGASVGAAWVSCHVLQRMKPAPPAVMAAALRDSATFQGPERRGSRAEPRGG